MSFDCFCLLSQVYQLSRPSLSSPSSRHHRIEPVSETSHIANHFINNPSHLVSRALESITLTNPNTAFDAVNKIVYTRPDAIDPTDSASHHEPQVAVISGGGSGHEPSFAGFVGPGMLSASVAGTIFASPAAEQVRRCILERVNGQRGVLVVVMNYTGDVLNFGMAVEKAKAAGRKVEMVVVGDDAGVGRKQGGKVGRRGIAGTVLVLKVAGALARSGANLKEVKRVAQVVADNTVSIGASLSHVHVPGRDPAEKDEGGLKAGEVEIGMGIHNESGSERMKAELTTIVKTMLKYVLDTESEDRGFLAVSSTDEVVLLVNNLGGVSVLELGGITAEVITQLQQDYGIRPVRVLSGTYMTSLNGLGFSISLTRNADLGSHHAILELLDAPAEVTGWSSTISSKAWSTKPSQTQASQSKEQDLNGPSGLALDAQSAREALERALECVIMAEPDITKFDTVVGDGDCGVGLKRGAEAIRSELAEISKKNDAAQFVDAVTAVVERTMDGTSGALYAIFLNALSTGLRRQHAASDTRLTDAATWAKALVFALESLGRYTPAKPGDRTLMDALQPFVDELHRSGSLQKAAAAASDGAQATKGMKASLGRTVYVGGSGYEEVPDPGAHGLAQFFQGLAGVKDEK